MANPFNKPLSKVSIKQILSLEPEEFSKLTAKESRTIEKRLRTTAQRRINTIAKHGKYSAAQERYIPNGLPEMSTDQSTRQLSQHNISVLREFLNAKSSTLTGIRKLTKETESRIFGKDSRGNPLRHFLNVDEEKRFWRAYTEFMHQNPSFIFSSTRIQQFLAQETFWRTRDFTADDFDRLFNKVINDGARVDIRATAALDEWI